MKMIIAFVVGVIAGVMSLTICRLLKKPVTPTPSLNFKWSDQFNGQNEWNVWDAASSIDYFNFEASLEDTKPHFIKEGEK